MNLATSVVNQYQSYSCRERIGSYGLQKYGVLFRFGAAGCKCGRAWAHHQADAISDLKSFLLVYNPCISIDSELSSHLCGLFGELIAHKHSEIVSFFFACSCRFVAIVVAVGAAVVGSSGAMLLCLFSCYWCSGFVVGILVLGTAQGAVSFGMVAAATSTTMQNIGQSMIFCCCVFVI